MGHKLIFLIWVLISLISPWKCYLIKVVSLLVSFFSRRSYEEVMIEILSKSEVALLLPTLHFQFVIHLVGFEHIKSTQNSIVWRPTLAPILRLESHQLSGERVQDIKYLFIETISIMGICFIQLYHKYEVEIITTNTTMNYHWT